MPIYEYECAACQHRLETMQKMSEAPLSECPECHQPTLRKLISAAGFQLKGNGWYATDFKGSGKKPAAAEKAPEAGASATPAPAVAASTTE